MFKDRKHEEVYKQICFRMSEDCYHSALAYLISLDVVCQEHINEIYDFEEQRIRPECISEPWQTGTSLKTVLLAFNLFTDHINWCPEELACYCTPSNIFCCSYALYYWEAVKLRYPEYTKVGNCPLWSEVITRKAVK